MKPAFARQNAWLLGLCQFCYMAATATGISFSGLVGARLAPWSSLATLPYLLITLSTALATLVVPRLLARPGPVHALFAAAPGRKKVRHKACDAGNNRLFPRSTTQWMTFFRPGPQGSGHYRRATALHAAHGIHTAARPAPCRTPALPRTLPRKEREQAPSYRRVFALGAVLGMAGGLVCVTALYLQSFALFCLAAPFQGFYQATALYYRYAAAEGAPDAHKGSAMAWVLSGGILAAFAGPLLGGYAVDRVPHVLYAGSFLGMASMALLALLPLALARLPAPPPLVAPAERTPWREVLATPRALGGMLGCAGGYGLMMFMMVASPLAIAGCGFTPLHAASVIQWHMLGMFAPSLVTGRLIARFGAGRVAWAGGVLNLAACALALGGLTLNHFHASLLLVGLGWNLMYMGGSTLIAQSPPAARARLQSANELLTFSVVAAAAGLAGWVYQALGWYAVAGIALGLTLALGAAAALLVRRPRLAAA